MFGFNISSWLLIRSFVLYRKDICHLQFDENSIKLIDLYYTQLAQIWKNCKISSTTKITIVHIVLLAHSFNIFDAKIFNKVSFLCFAVCLILIVTYSKDYITL